IVIYFCFRKFIARLPDKGKKISDFAEKLKLAVLQEEELARTAELLSAVRLEFQVKQEEINTSKQQVSEISSQRQEAEYIEQDATNTALESQRTQRKNDKVETVTEDQNLFCEVISKSSTGNYLRNDQQVSQSNIGDGAESTAALDDSKDMLVD
ncbi:GRL1A polymerase, partial [Aegotheles bennettii]|nr:GRL1A polymerase [Aegotheles bennettii]